MKTIYKLILLFIITVLFIVICNIVLAESLLWQACILLLILSGAWLRFGLARMISEVKLLIPFIALMLVAYLVIGIFGFRISSQVSEHSSVNFWIIYGLNKSFMFVNTILFLQIVLSFITIVDILNFPLRINSKKYLILGRALFVHTLQNLGNMELHLRLIPEYQKKSLTFKQWFNLKLQLSYGVISMMLRESHLKGELIDNRIQHCFNSTSESIGIVRELI